MESSVIKLRHDYTMTDDNLFILNISKKTAFISLGILIIIGMILEQIYLIPEFNIYTVLPAYFFILSSIFLSIAYGNRKRYSLLPILLDFAGLAFLNNFLSFQTTGLKQQIMSLIFDICSFSSLLITRLYVYREFKTAKIFPKLTVFLKYYLYFPIMIFVTKYLVLSGFDFVVTDPRIMHFTHFYITISGIFLIFLCIFMQINFKSQTTLPFRMFLFSSVMGFLPLIIIYSHSILIYHKIVTSSFTERIIGTTFPFIAVCLDFSVIQFSNEKINKVGKKALIILSYCEIISCLAQMALYITDSSNIKYAIYVLLILAPITFRVILYTINRFFSSKDTGYEAAKKIFNQKIDQAKDFNELFELTTKEIIRNLDSSFVFFQYFTENHTSSIANYSELEMHPYFIKSILAMADAVTDDEGKVNQLNNGAHFISFYQGDMLYCRVFIGQKKNEELYINDELEKMNSITRDFFRGYLYIDNILQSEKLEERNRKIIEIQNNTIMALANLVENRDSDTGQHIKRTSAYVKLIANKLRENGYYSQILTDQYINHLVKAAPMHDIGKIVVPDNVLKKNGRLTDEEFTQIKRHTTEGSKIVEEILGSSEDREYVIIAKAVALGHHEKWNGKGYPNNQKANSIPLCARIMAVADVFDALVSPRCYKEPFTLDKAFSIIEEETGSQFDPIIARVFIKSRKDVEKIFYENND